MIRKYRIEIRSARTKAIIRQWDIEMEDAPDNRAIEALVNEIRSGLRKTETVSYRERSSFETRHNIV